MKSTTLRNDRPITIVPAAASSQKRLYEFYARVYPDRTNFLNHHWKWLYSSDRLKTPHSWPITAVDQAQSIVGYAGIIPGCFNIKGKIIEGAWFVDYFVNKEFRGTGLAGSLIQQVMSSSPLVATIGSSQKGEAVFRHYGWTEVLGPRYYSLPINLSRHPRFRSSKIKHILAPADIISRQYWKLKSHSHGEDYDLKPITTPLLKEFIDDRNNLAVDFSQYRDEGFLRWRVLEFPLQDQIRVFYSSNSKALLRCAKSPQYFRITVLALKSKDPLLFFKHIIQIAHKMRADEIALVSSDPILQQSFNKCFPVKKNLPMYFYSQSNYVSPLPSIDSMRFEMIDSDLDLA